VQAEFAGTIHALTDGNPFFIEETLKALVASGDIYFTASGWARKPIGELHIPCSVQDAVQRRMGQLSEPARQLLTLAAVAGQRFDFALLQQLTGRNEPELLASIRELITAQLVVEESAEQFKFRHALTREAIYSDLLTRERRTLHRAIAETLERRGAGNALLSELSYHFFAAEVWEKALDYARRAGERAHTLYTPRAVVAHYTRAIESARQLSTSAPLELHHLRGQMYQTSGEIDSARDDFQTMLDEAQRRGDRQSEWQALLELGFLWAARDLEDSATLAHSLNRIGKPN